MSQQKITPKINRIPPPKKPKSPSRIVHTKTYLHLQPIQRLGFIGGKTIFQMLNFGNGT